MTDIYGGIMDGLQLARTGAEQHKQRGLASLVGKAYSAPQAQRGGLLAQIAGIDPATATQTQSSLGAWDDSKQEALVRSAKMLLTAPEEARPQVWAQIVQAGEIPGLQPTYDPVKVPEMAQKIVQQFGGASSTAEMQNFAAMTGGFTPQQIQEARLIQAGLKPRAGLLHVGEYAGGIYGVNRDPSKPHAIPVGIGAPQRGGGEVPFSIDPSLPPEIQADIRRSEAQGQPWTQAPQGGQLPPALDYQGGGQLQAAPKQLDPIALANLQLAQQRANEPSDFERRLQMAREMGATPEQLQQMVLGSSGGGKPTATQLRQANVAKTKLIDLRAIRNQLQTVKERFGPLKNTLSAGGIYGVGGNLIPSEDGQRFDAAVDLMRQFVRKMTRTPGEGAMSDWEGRLANLANPSRGDREAVTEDKIAQLEQLIDSLEQGYGAVLQDNGGNMDNVSPPDAPRSNAVNGGAWMIEVSE